MEKKMIEIIEKAKHGDEEAFLELYNRYYKQAFYYALKLCHGNEADAYDATQDAFSTMFTEIQHLHSPEYFVAWMSKVVLSKCTKIFRKKKEVFLDSEGLNMLFAKETHNEYLPELHMHKNVDIEVMHTLISKLSLKLQEIVQLIYIEQKTIKETAAILKIPEGTVKSRMNQARIHLRELALQFEKKEGRKIDFKEGSTLPALGCIATLRKLKYKILSVGYVQTGMLASLTLACVLSVPALIQHKENQVMPQKLAVVEFTPISYQGKQISTYKSAYFTILSWGANDIEIQQKSIEEKNSIQEVVSRIRGSDSVYKKMLEEQDWFQLYEDL